MSKKNVKLIIKWISPIFLWNFFGIVICTIHRWTHRNWIWIFNEKIQIIMNETKTCAIKSKFVYSINENIKRKTKKHNWKTNKHTDLYSIYMYLYVHIYIYILCHLSSPFYLLHSLFYYILDRGPVAVCISRSISCSYFICSLLLFFLLFIHFDW